MMSNFIPDRTFGFTIRFDKLSNVLNSQTKISQAFHPAKTKKPPITKIYHAIWDTGATGTVITHKVVRECGLKPIGITKVHTASGENTTSVYLVNIVLRSNVGIAHLKVTEGILKAPFDMLIGMDVMNRGDFAVTNRNGKTTFSFRIPSIEEIDFVDKSQPAKPPLKRATAKIGRNAPCSCGSGKKYKKCCGK